jgi:hypothetical protein
MPRTRLKQLAQDGATDGQHLEWDNAAGVWKPVTPSGGGGLPPMAWDPANHGTYPSTAAARTNRGVHPVWAFDAGTDEDIILQGYMPASYDAGSLEVKIQWAGDGVTTGDVKWNVSWERLHTGQDLDTGGGAADQTATTTTSGTDGQTVVTTIAFTQAQADSIAAGERFQLQVTRDANAAGDTMAADAQVVGVWVESA